MKNNAFKNSKIKKGAIRWLVRETLGNLFLMAILFGIAGRLNWYNGWALSGVYMTWTLLCAILILPKNPEMLAERARPHKNARKWDVFLIGLMGASMVIEYVIASLDVRFGWSIQLPVLVQVTGLVFAICGYDFLLVWSMVSNAYFIATVRIQSERGHTVISSGPYRYVRHPGYSGTVLMNIGTPFMLNSLWAIIPALTTILVIIVRTHLEDKMLQNELPGYKAYSSKVSYRLIPGVW